jgi:hypothetical protein
MSLFCLQSFIIEAISKKKKNMNRNMVKVILFLIQIRLYVSKLLAL